MTVTLERKPAHAAEVSMPRRALTGALLAGVVAALVVPVTRPGLGWLLAGLAAIGAVVLATRRATTTGGARTGGAAAGDAETGGASDGGAGEAVPAGGQRVERGSAAGRLIAAGGVVLLLAAGTLRAAGWLFALCVLTALPLASLAVAGGGAGDGNGSGTGGGAWRRLVRGMAALVMAVPPGLSWAARRRDRDADGVDPRTRRLVTGLAAGAVLLLVFGGLFASADPVFAHLVRGWLPHLTVGHALADVVLLAVTGGLTVAAVFLRAVDSPAAPVEPAGARRRLHRYEWAVPLVLLDALFGVFIWVQVTTLFGGNRYVLGPGGPTFAEYARSGFWQLVLVTVLSLGTVAVPAYRADRTGRGDRMLVRLLAGALCLCTVVIVASALVRMSTYVQAYGFTRLRLVGFAGELCLGVVLVLLLLAGVRLRGRWLPVAITTTVVATVLGLAAVNPDAVVARTIIGRYRTDGHLDAVYLSGLSADAIPEIDKLPEPQRSCILWAMADRPSTVDPWYAFNLGRRTGLAVVERPVQPGSEPCPFVIPGPRNDG
jgi:hypothetical protein